MFEGHYRGHLKKKESKFCLHFCVAIQFVLQHLGLFSLEKKKERKKNRIDKRGIVLFLAVAIISDCYWNNLLMQ